MLYEGSLNYSLINTFDEQVKEICFTSKKIILNSTNYTILDTKYIFETKCIKLFGEDHGFSPNYACNYGICRVSENNVETLTSSVRTRTIYYVLLETDAT